MEVSYFMFALILAFVKGQENDIELDTRVSGGFSPSHERVPYEIHLRSFSRDGKGFSCSGSLLSPRTVLTAAHCLEGMYKVNVEVIRGTTVQVYESQEVLPHPKYSGITYENDIGLVQLAQAVPLSSQVMPLVLPRGPQLRPGFFTNRDLLATGWGLIDRQYNGATEVQSLKVRLANDRKCINILSWWYPKDSRYGRLCSFFNNTKKGLCPGDSGGPLVMEPNTIVGVTSLMTSSELGCRCGCRGLINIFISVIPHISWIQENLV